MSKVDHTQKPDLGYWFAPKRYPHSPGHPRLDIAISKIASGLHFDPETIQLPVFADIDRLHPRRIEHLKIFHPWAYRSSYHVAPGMVIISDRKNKKVEAFTFGGMLEIDTSDEFTKCRIESSAPIIDIPAVGAAVMKLVEEVEIILATRRAIWGQDEREFTTRLKNVPSDVFYAACFQEFQDRIGHSHVKEIETIQDFRNFIVGEKRSLTEEGLWPEKVPTISEIL